MYASVHLFQAMHDCSRNAVSLFRSDFFTTNEGKGRVSHETIYRRIWADKQRGGMAWQHLRLRLTRGRRYRRYGKRGQIVGRIGIEHRAAIVDRRSRRGDWEIDTVFGRRGESRDALLTMVDRRTKLSICARVAPKPDSRSPMTPDSVASRSCGILPARPRAEQVPATGGGNGTTRHAETRTDAADSHASGSGKPN